jgi:hypothetical protein
MKSVLALIFSSSTLAFSTMAFSTPAAAQDKAAQDKAAQDKAAGDKEGTPGGTVGDQDTPAKRVSSVTWNAQTGKLEWVVQSGVERNGDFVPSSQEDHYEIAPEQAIMAFQGQQRGFTDQEASWLQGLLHVLTVYCAESTIWWDQGHGVPMDHGKPTGQPPADQSTDPDPLPHRVMTPLPRKTPGAIRLVAVNLIN